MYNYVAERYYVAQQEFESLKKLRDKHSAKKEGQSQSNGNVDKGNPLKRQSKKQLQDSRRSFQKLIEEHKDKINNPDKYIDPSKIKGDPVKYRQGLIEKWERDLARQQRDLRLTEDLLKLIDYLP
ncbi:MAG: hypothetical protein TR69_WS6001001061 [candidate division WS6 bacterium OLB20]|uniref:Uncharacterized protein n=1 Tax=candidate division WS6 bacterium OLB20 TaxID=1617426 RepID=A0A136LZG9_9BACT|nr:MAG: hypothetical protein TR69_WS6001001061 [candidate division WS6 bacterium OLB20]